MIGREQLVVHGRPAVKPLGKAAGHQLDQIPVARLVLHQQHQMILFLAVFAILVKTAVGRDVDLAADDRLDALGRACLVERHGAVHHPMVGDGDGGMSGRLRRLRDVFDAAGSVQKAVFAV